MLLRRYELIKAILNYHESVSRFENDFDEIIEIIDDYSGYLGDDRYYDMDMLDDLLCGLSPTDILEKINFDNFSLYDSYFKFDVYGIESSNTRDYRDFIDSYFVGQLIDVDDYIREIEDCYFDSSTITMIELIKLYHESERFETIENNEGFFSEDFFSIIDNDVLELHHVGFLKEYLPTNCKAYNEVKKLYSEMYNNVA